MMNLALMPSIQWAQAEFGQAELGDQRRTQRLMNIATRLADRPAGTLPQAFPAWKDLKAAYRFFEQPAITREAILAPHFTATRARLCTPGEYLLIEDTTELDYSHCLATEGLGMIGNGQGRGFLLHSTLAFQVEAWNPDQRPEGIAVGLVGQRCWRRRSGRRTKENWRQRVERPRESQRWAAVLEELNSPPPDCRWILLTDREGDFYEPIERCQRRGVDFIIRSFRRRKVVGCEERLPEAVAHLPIRGRMTVALRARPGQAARSATVEVRSGTLAMRGPERRGQPPPAFTVNVVEVQEVGAPAGVEPLHWRLLTSLPCTDWVAAQRVVGRYARRWCVEEYHKALKTGAGAEESQLEQAYRIETLLGVLAIVAIRLLNLQYLARTQPQAPVDAQVFGPEALALLGALCGVPVTGWTCRSVLVAVARLGGFPARKSDGLPGWQRIWRGWHRLRWMCLGVAAQQAGGTGGYPDPIGNGQELEILKRERKRCG